MKYTRTIPDTPGFYWCKIHSIEFITEIRIEKGKPYSYCHWKSSRSERPFSYWFYHNKLDITNTTAWWAGPIQKPME